MTAIQIMIVEPLSLSAKTQKTAKAGQAVIVTTYKDKKTGRLKGKNGRIIWDGKDFVFFPEKEKY